MNTVNITIAVPAVMNVTCGTGDNREIFDVDTAAVHESWLVFALQYGMQQKVNDSFSSTKVDDGKAKLIEDLVKEINKGAVLQERIQSARGGYTAIEALAIKNAKVELQIKFKRITGKGKALDMVTANEAVAAYFKVTEDRAVWLDAKVMEYIKSGKASTDFLADAERTLEGAETVGADDI